MIRPPDTLLSRALLSFAMVISLARCVDGEPSNENVVRGAIADGPTCTTQDPGCACEPGTEPVPCTETIDDGSSMICESGAMYCAGGVWSACETVTTWRVPKTIPAPGACSPCNPDCHETNDEPDQDDIDSPPNDVSFDNVEYSTGTPRGIRPIPETTTSTGGGVDTDMDGVPDSADDCPTMMGPPQRFGCPTTTGSEGFFHVLPPGASATDPLTFDVELREADIYFLMDTTGSMGDEIDNLRTDLTTGVFDPACPSLRGIIGAIRCTIPGTWFGVGQFEDYPVSPYGYSSWNDLPYRHLQDLTDDTGAAQSAVNGLFTRNGRDIPEGNSQALYAMATGEGLSYDGTQYLAPRTGCPAGRWGYPCFRRSVIPIVIMITDAAMHNGPNGQEYAGTTVGSTNGGSLGDTNSLTDLGEVTGGSVAYTGSTRGANDDYRDGGCHSRRSNDRLFEFTVARRTEITIDLSGSSYDTVMFLYQGTGTSNLVTCDDDGGAGTASRIVRTLNPGTYTVRVDGYGNDEGNFDLFIGEEVRIPGGVPYPDVVAAMNARGIRVIGVNSGPSSAYADLSDLATDTNSLDGDGDPFINEISSDGNGLTTAVVDAVVDLANFSRLDVDVIVEDVMLTSTVHASDLVDSVIVGSPGCSAGCRGAVPNGCSRCLPGTSLPFEVTFRNDVIAPTTVDQVFNFDLIVRGNFGAIELQRVPVRIVVPADVPSTTYAPGTFTRLFRAADTCAIPPTRPDWGNLQWDATVPGDATVTFSIRTADDEAALAGTAPVSFSVPADAPGRPSAAQFVNLAQFLRGRGAANFKPFVEIEVTLTPTTAGTDAPTLTSMGLQFTCIDME